MYFEGTVSSFKYLGPTVIYFSRYNGNLKPLKAPTQRAETIRVIYKLSTTTNEKNYFEGTYCTSLVLNIQALRYIVISLEIMGI